jgi:hypothetical protein
MDDLNKIIGVVVLAAMIGAGIFFKMYKSDADAIVLKGFIGGEKANFLENEKVKKILKSKYKIILEYSKAGSIEMVQSSNIDNMDFLWPSSQVALELFKIKNPKKIIKSEIILNSPIVFYSWDSVTDALIKEEIVVKKENSYYISDFKKLINIISIGKKWSDIGLKELYGKILILSTDPTKSNSGIMFAGLLANILNGDTLEESSLPEIGNEVREYFSRLGYMETSSSDLFEQYLKTGMGAKPIIAGYENQIVEFSIEHKDFWPKVKEKIRILYPLPTVWSSQPLIILNPKAVNLITALQDKEIQQIAWETHGFRTGLIGQQNDPKILEVVGIPESITQVVPMPNPIVMEKLIKIIKP